MAQAPSFPRVLTGALSGAMLGGAAWMLATGRPKPLDSNAFLFLAVPAGMMLGARVAIGRGGTARWAALLFSWGVWSAVAALRLRWNVGYEHPWVRASALAFLAGGWAVLVWRAMAGISGAPSALGRLPLALAGLWLTEILLSPLTACVRPLLELIPMGVQIEVLQLAVVPSVMAVILVCALGGMGSLAGNLDIPWGVASTSSVLGAFLLVAGEICMEKAVPAWGRHADAVVYSEWILFRVAWFSWWAHRLTRGAC